MHIHFAVRILLMRAVSHRRSFVFCRYYHILDFCSCKNEIKLKLWYQNQLSKAKIQTRIIFSPQNSIPYLEKKNSRLLLLDSTEVKRSLICCHWNFSFSGNSSCSPNFQHIWHILSNFNVRTITTSNFP